MKEHRSKCNCHRCKRERMLKAIFGHKTDVLIAQEIARERARERARQKPQRLAILKKIAESPSRQFKFN